MVKFQKIFRLTLGRFILREDCFSNKVIAFLTYFQPFFTLHQISAKNLSKLAVVCFLQHFKLIYLIFNLIKPVYKLFLKKCWHEQFGMIRGKEPVQRKWSRCGRITIKTVVGLLRVVWLCPYIHNNNLRFKIIYALKARIFFLLRKINFNFLLISIIFLN